MANFTPKNHRTRGLETAADAAKALFLVVGIASTAFLTSRFALPYLLALPSLSLPKLRSCAVSWLSPPYLFITVHFIIMVIWKLHRSQNPQADVLADRNPPVDVENGAETPAEESPRASGPRPSEVVDEEISADDQHLPWPPPEPEPEPEPKDIHEDGLDATWQAIMNGKSAPVGSQLKKSGTWEKAGGLARAGAVDAQNFKKRDDEGDGVSSTGVQKFKKSDTFREKKRGGEGDPAAERREMRKSKTFRESAAGAAATARAGGGWRGRDALVVGRDELFGRVEAFIKMNHQQRFVEMVNATAY